MTALPPPPLAPEAAVRRLTVTVGRRLDGLLAGDHLGFLPGPGSERAEARLYAPGDDARGIDWAVTARTGETHVRTATADRELETTLVVDLTPSMAFGTSRSEKRDLAIAAAAGVAQLTSGSGDRVGALVLGGSGVRRVPPRTGRTAALALQHLLTSEPRVTDGVGPPLADAIAALLLPPRRRGLVLVLSDLLEPGVPAEPSWARPLRQLATRSDVVVAQVVDPRELELPAVGLLRLVDPETGRTREVQTSAGLRARYAEAARARGARHRAAVRRAGARHVVLRTDRDWLPDLARCLARRPTTARPEFSRV